MEIMVEGALDQALRVLKRKLAKEGVFKEWRKRAFHEKPSVRRKRKRTEAESRRRKERKRRRRPLSGPLLDTVARAARQSQGYAHLVVGIASMSWMKPRSGYGFVEFRVGNDTETLPHLIRRVTEILATTVSTRKAVSQDDIGFRGLEAVLDDRFIVRRFVPSSGVIHGGKFQDDGSSRRPRSFKHFDFLVHCKHPAVKRGKSAHDTG